MKITFSFLLLVSFCVASSQPKIIIDNEKITNGVILYATNNEYCPVSVKFNFNLENLDDSAAGSNIIVVPARTQKIKIAELKVIDSKKRWGFSYNFHSNFGNAILQQYDTNYVNDLPYKKGNRFLVFQGYNGNFSHQNENALDFKMPEGTEILAVRDGIVIRVVQNNTLSCAEPGCIKYNNYLLIYHSDGTFATYAHIQFNGSKVNENDIVKAGDVIALSGNVGYTNGPHLHLICFLPGIEKIQSVMTKFRTGNGNTVKYLHENESYSRKY